MVAPRRCLCETILMAELVTKWQIDGQEQPRLWTRRPWKARGSTLRTPWARPLISIMILVLPALIYDGSITQFYELMHGPLPFQSFRKPRRRKNRAIYKRRIKHQTTAGYNAKDELDTHADKCCAGTNWSLMELTGKLCDVNPFLASYQPVQEILVAQCCTVWIDQTNSMEYLLVGDQCYGSAHFVAQSIASLCNQGS
jgi:hypothetical protein